MNATAGLVLSCEHGGNEVPPEYAHLFRSPRAKAALKSHLGFDPGALAVARFLAARFEAALVHSTVTRLLVELNKSERHAKLFSEFSQELDPSERRVVLSRYYRPHREAVTRSVMATIEAAGVACHVAVHSFTPTLHGEPRRADVGLLYDPARPLERELCARWRSILIDLEPGLRVRRNYPYLGKDDGLTTHLRRSFDAQRYVGIELELNQGLLADASSRDALQQTILESVERLFQPEE